MTSLSKSGNIPANVLDWVISLGLLGVTETVLTLLLFYALPAVYAGLQQPQRSLGGQQHPLH